MDVYQSPDPMPLATGLDWDGVEKLMDKYGATQASRKKLRETGSVIIGGVEVWVSREDESSK